MALHCGLLSGSFASAGNSTYMLTYPDQNSTITSVARQGFEAWASLDPESMAMVTCTDDQVLIDDVALKRKQFDYALEAGGHGFDESEFDFSQLAYMVTWVNEDQDQALVQVVGVLRMDHPILETGLDPVNDEISMIREYGRWVMCETRKVEPQFPGKDLGPEDEFYPETPEGVASAFQRAMFYYDIDRASTLVCQEMLDMVEEMRIDDETRDKMLKVMEFDFTGLKYELVNENDFEAHVRVSGTISVSISDSVKDVIEMDEIDLLVKENGRWKACQ